MSSEKKLARPGASDCEVYKSSLDFVISNLKFSLIHHNARIDGTMVKAWEQERDILKGQLKTLSSFPADNPRRISVQQQLEKDLSNVERMMEMTKNPQEFKRLEGMCDMHERFVRTLESLQPLLRQQCP